jgi:hypothetical protein
LRTRNYAAMIHSMTDYNRLIRECFWDLNISEHDIEQIISGDNQRSKKQLFKKILLNSSRYLIDLRLFDREELYFLLEAV